MNPKVRLHLGHPHSQFWPILGRFVGYYSPFWGSRVITMVFEPQGTLTSWSSIIEVLAVFTIDDPRGVFTCRSSTLEVLADSGLFRGLLLAVLGPRAISPIAEQGCVYMSVISTRSFCRLRSVSWAILLIVLCSRSDP